MSEQEQKNPRIKQIEQIKGLVDTEIAQVKIHYGEAEKNLNGTAKIGTQEVKEKTLSKRLRNLNMIMDELEEALEILNGATYPPGAEDYISKINFRDADDEQNPIYPFLTNADVTKTYFKNILNPSVGGRRRRRRKSRKTKRKRRKSRKTKRKRRKSRKTKKRRRRRR